MTDRVDLAKKWFGDGTDIKKYCIRELRDTLDRIAEVQEEIADAEKESGIVTAPRVLEKVLNYQAGKASVYRDILDVIAVNNVIDEVNND